MALDHHKVRLHTVIKVRLPGKSLPPDMLPETVDVSDGRVPLVETTVGRLIFNQCFPDSEEYVNRPLHEGEVGRLVDAAVHRYDRAQVEQILDNLKNVGFHYATRAGVTLGMRGRHHAAGQGDRSWTGTRRTRPRSRPSTARASSPTTSGARSSSRSGPTPPTR